jgi:hypothetical protein
MSEEREIVNGDDAWPAYCLRENVDAAMNNVKTETASLQREPKLLPGDSDRRPLDGNRRPN